MTTWTSTRTSATIAPASSPSSRSTGCAAARSRRAGSAASGSRGRSNEKLYLIGTLVATRAASGSVRAGSGAFQIGGNTIWNEWFNGLIDEVRVYDRALSEAEIKTDR